MVRSRILIDLTVLENRPFTGVEFYALEVASRLAEFLPDCTLSAALGRATVSDAELPGLVLYRGRRLPRWLWRRTTLPALARHLETDLLFAPISHVPGSASFLSLRTVHDLGRPPRAPRPRRMPTIVPSEATRAQLESLVAEGAELRVIHHGVDEACFGLERRPDSQPRALVLGSYRERRTPELVARAASIVAGRVPGFELHWIGKGTENEPESEGLRFRGYLERAAVHEALSRARFLLVPSLVEGFGLPVLEAMAAGLPVLAREGPAIAEIGGDMVTTYATTEAEDLALAMTRMLQADSNPEEKALRQWAQRFNWEASVEAHARFMRELLELS